MSEVRRTCVSGQCWAAAALGAADQVRLRVSCMCVCVCCWTGGNRASSVCCSVWVDVGEDGGILLILLIELVRLGSWQRTKGGRRHPWTFRAGSTQAYVGKDMCQFGLIRSIYFR